MKCSNCGQKIVRFPLKDNNGRLIVKNLFKIDLMSILLILLITLMVIGYKVDIKKCEEVIEKPCEFCETTGCCKVDWEKIRPDNIYENINIENIPKFNVT